ncbi:hypothetical protein Tco_1523932 [Tanacetum coccineum]
MGGIGGGSFANRLMVAKDGLGGDGFVVDGERSLSTLSRDREDGGVKNKSSMGSRLIATGEIVVERLLEKLVELPIRSLMVERMVDREKKKHCEERKDTRGRSEEDGQELCTIYRERWAREQVCRYYSEKGTGLKFEWHRSTGRHDFFKFPMTWPQVRKSSFAKPYDVNAPGPSRNSPKHVSYQTPGESVGSNDMVGLKWIPIRKQVETCYNTNDSASPLGKETHNPKTVICANSSSLSAGTSMASKPISSNGSSNVLVYDLSKNWRDLPKDTHSFEIAVLRYDLEKDENMGIMPVNKIELNTRTISTSVSNLSLGRKKPGHYIIYRFFKDDSDIKE